MRANFAYVYDCAAHFTLDHLVETVAGNRTIGLQNTG